MTDAPLTVVREGPVRWIRLNRPDKRNALDGDLADALAAQVDDVERDDDTRVVVLAGAGPSFCAGGDFAHFLRVDGDGESVVGFLTSLSATLTRIETSRTPWIAAVHGHAIAGGLELALVCDVVIAARGTLIGDGHLRNRLLPGAGSSVRLERAVGKSVARWMHLSGELLPAERLERTGWIHEVVAPDELDAQARRIARQLAQPDAAAQRRLKALLIDIHGTDDAAALAAELDAFGDNWADGRVAATLTHFLAARGTSTTQEKSA